VTRATTCLPSAHHGFGRADLPPGSRRARHAAQILLMPLFPLEAGQASDRQPKKDPYSAGRTGLARFPESLSSFSRFRSAHNSDAVWQRASRSFSSALLMVSSRRAGRSGRSRSGERGVLLRRASKNTAVVLPETAAVPWPSRRARRRRKTDRYAHPVSRLAPARATSRLLFLLPSQDLSAAPRRFSSSF
jgi:hypothetical protein